MSLELSKRFVALVKRELGASSVRLRERSNPTEVGILTAALPDGRRVEVRFAEPPENPKATKRRFQMLISAFGDTAQRGVQAKPRDPPAVSLRKELKALVKRSHALDAAVIDAQSPVVWASARAEDEDDEDARTARAHQKRAIAELRALPQLGTLRRGGHLALSVREERFGYVVRSFAGIYVLVLMFDHAFDEIRAERALRDSLSRVERLVLAIPPFDPDPVPAGVVSLRPRRRR